MREVRLHTASMSYQATFALFAHNHEAYIEQALEAAFKQDLAPLDIIVLDDASADRTLGIIQECCEHTKHKHSVRVIANERNQGWGAQIQKAFALAKCEWVVFAAGDDISKPSRVRELLGVVARNPQARAVFSSYDVIDDAGLKLKTAKRLWQLDDSPTLTDIAAGGGGVGLGATYCYHATVGVWPSQFPVSLTQEDRILPLRAALLGSVEYTSQELVTYRLSRGGHSRSQRDLAIFEQETIQHIDELGRTVENAKGSFEWPTAAMLVLRKIVECGKKLALADERVRSAVGVHIVTERIFRKRIAVALKLYRKMWWFVRPTHLSANALVIKRTSRI